MILPVSSTFNSSKNKGGFDYRGAAMSAILYVMLQVDSRKNVETWFTQGTSESTPEVLELVSTYNVETFQLDVFVFPTREDKQSVGKRSTVNKHGVRQIRIAWVDGPEFITQCPIRPGKRQVGTLWWHGHSSWLRATVYGALVIRPRQGDSDPFPKPNRDSVAMLGKWWDANPIDVIKEATGGAPNVSDAYTINGQPGDLYKCSPSK
ncbi:laccase-12-like protein, partial [Tanacetum coccineum]